MSSNNNNPNETYDPFLNKSDPYSNSYPTAPVNAHPVQTQPTYVVGTVAQPPTQAQYYGPQPTNTIVGNATTLQPRPPAHRWRDSICDWPANLFPSCYCVCCCCYGIWLQAQMGQKVGYSTFRSVIYAYIFFWILAFIIQLAAGGAILIWLPMIFAFIYSIGLRLFIVNKEQITECGSSACLGECCVGFWCWYCSVAQMARHVYGYSKVLDGDGDPDRPDNYIAMQV